MKRPNLPSCSLIISTYNWPQALERSLLSAYDQVHVPDEIIVADDGSDHRTKDLIKNMARRSPVPLLHIWHSDIGFRLSEIRNKAISAANFEYIIQIDGDIIMEKNFVLDHLSMAKSKTFLCGSRVLLKPNSVDFSLKHEKAVLKKNLPLGYIMNSFRIPCLGKILADRYKQKKVTALRGCNMSFWRKDLIAINGYNNEIVGWGSEDAELAVRLVNSGVKKRALKFMAIAFHIYHKESNKINEEQNKFILSHSLKNNITRINKGINDHSCDKIY